MEYNKCKTCKADNGRAGLLINDECINCHKTRETENYYVDANLNRSSEELQRTFNILTT